MTTLEWSQLCEQAAEVIRQTGYFLLEESGKVKTGDISDKSLNQLVSYVDKTAERQLIEGLTKLLPDAGFIAEEGTVEKTNHEFQWIIDPLDGTTNFLHQLPFYTISVALMYKNELVIGIIYEPNRRELFHSWKGGNAYLNDDIISVSQNKLLKDSLLATGFPYYDFHKMDAYIECLTHFMRSTRGLRRCGSAALDLAYVAAGRFDGYFEYSLSPWDVAAGAFLVQQAGGLVSDFSGENNYLFGKEIITGNVEIHRRVLNIVQTKFSNL